MYEGFSKSSGDVIVPTTIISSITDKTVGDHDQSISPNILVNKLELGDLYDSTAAEESMVCIDPDSNEEIILTSKLDPYNGELLWIRSEKDIVMKRTISMSQMTSMLNDLDRNRIYEYAISVIIDNFYQLHKRYPVILDIGTGTGLLSLLCTRYKAEFVFGIEMFDAMSKVAEKVVAENELEEKILIINAKSNDIDELPISPDILVSELIDSALLGEGCIPAHQDAMIRLLNHNIDTTDASTDIEATITASDINTDNMDRILPYSGMVYATLITSEEIQKMHEIRTIQLGGMQQQHQPSAYDAMLNASTIHNDQIPYHNIATTNNSKQQQQLFTPYRELNKDMVCPLGWNTIPVHWDKLQQRGGKVKSDPTAILHISLTELPTEDSIFSAENVIYETDVVVTEAGLIHGILLWWKLYLLSPNLDPNRECFYSSEPATGLPDSGGQNWQDHWQQTMVLLPTNVHVEVGDLVTIQALHNSVRIDVSISNVCKQIPSIKKRFRNETVTDLLDDEINSHSVSSSVMRPLKCIQKYCKINEDETEDEGLLPVIVAGSDQQCNCGWHILCGPERFQMMCDSSNGLIWQHAIEKMLTTAEELIVQLNKAEEQSRDTIVTSSLNNIILDAGDGSLLGLSAALKLNNYLVLNNSTCIVSKENKLFSRMFFDQLSDANNVQEKMFIWDGVDLSDMFNHATSSTEQDDAIDDIDGDDSNSFYIKKLSSKIVAVMSECFYYQLRALPLWQLLTFYYYRSYLYREQLLHPQCITLPSRAILRAVAVELTHLHKSHGPVQRVSGFGHKAFDYEVADWYKHSYPYKLGNYEKEILSEPLTICTLDIEDSNFCLPIDGLITQTLITKQGRCDAIALWVDYHLIDDLKILNFNHKYQDFPHYYIVNLKYFENPINVLPGNQLKVIVKFTFGDADFNLDFSII